MRSRPKTPPEHGSTMARVVERNIQTLLARRQKEIESSSLQDRIADRITDFTGSMPFAYLHLCLFGFWVIWNLPWLPFPKFDPTYVTLAMFASVEAIFLSTFVLITQNRLAAQADKRADLDLQISLLTEHELTRLITLVSAMAEKMGVDESKSPELGELKKDIVPEQVLDKIEETEERFRE